MARLTNLPSAKLGIEASAPAPAPFQRNPPIPFFQLGSSPSKGEEAGSEPAEDASAPEAPKVTRAQRLQGGIPANQMGTINLNLDRAMKLVQPAAAKELLGEVSRGARLDITTWDQVEELAGGSRKMAAWARSAVQLVAQHQVPPSTLKDAAAVIQRRREEDGGRGRSLSVALGESIKHTVEVLARRARISEQAVLEGCIELCRLAACDTQQDPDDSRAE